MTNNRNTTENITTDPFLDYSFTNTSPAASKPFSIRPYDGFSLHLVVDYQNDQVAVIAGTDAVVASTGVWTFGNYTFTGLVGAKIQVSGALNAGNNGTFAITAVSGHTATTATTGLVNETFGPNVVVTVIRSEAASVPSGAWTVQGSNDYALPTPSAGTPGLGVPGNTGHFSDVTAFFATPSAIAAVTDASSQIRQPSTHLSFRFIQFTFTPAGGLGRARAYFYGKDWTK